MSDWTLLIEREFAVRCHECKTVAREFMTREEAQVWAMRHGWVIDRDSDVPRLLCYECAKEGGFE